MRSIRVAEGNAAFRSGDGVLFSADGRTLVAYPSGKTATAYVVPDGVVEIAPYAFQGCKTLAEVEFPSRLRTIGACAFSGTALTDVALPSGLETLGDAAFAECESLTEISLPDGLQTLGAWAFSQCRALRAVALPPGLRTLPTNAFDRCSSLTQVAFPEGLETLGDRAFAQCSSLVEISLPDGLQTVGDRAFAKCSSLRKVAFQEGERSRSAPRRSSVVLRLPTFRFRRLCERSTNTRFAVANRCGKSRCRTACKRRALCRSPSARRT